MTAPLEFPRFCSLPKGLVIDPACPSCGNVERWQVHQPLGEAPGCVDPGTGVPAPRMGGGVLMRCGMCGKQREYRITAPPMTPDMPGPLL